jgi:hypothetical protein
VSRSARLCSTATLLLMLTASSAGAQPVAGERPQGNAALRYWMAFALMQDQPIAASAQTAIDRVLQGEQAWSEAELGPLLDANASALNELRRGTLLQSCDWGLDYELGPSTPVAHIPKARVIGRLNALAGARFASRGQASDAVDSWLSGLRFARHVAQGGGLISALTAKSIFDGNVRAAIQAIRAGSIGSDQQRRITDVIRGLPVAAFDWADAIEREASTIEIAMGQLSASTNPAATYRTLTGATPPPSFRVPSSADMQAYRVFMRNTATAFRAPPDRTSTLLVALESNRTALPALLQGFLPSLQRINSERAEIERERQDLLAVSRAR